ncbi:MAG: PQQ-binding-like beta-propeller repeat protein [Proteobacteria bacterium]|nr:PQQ-binding-like beta-propeller repeat protein [Pseudomonadota bacterium]MCP4916975.1 PQQ-binding-like beta-propeller repeat protein [Pseudomonadota bacterium]
MILLALGGLLGEAFDMDRKPLEAHYAGTFGEAPVPHWQRMLPGPRLQAFSHTERGRPATDGTDLYLGSAAVDALLQVSRVSGEEVSRYEAGAPVQSQPVLVGDSILFADSGGYTWRYAVGAEESTWSHFGGAPVEATPTLDGSRVYVANVDDVVYALDARTGELQWRYARPPDPLRDSELTLFGAPSPVVVGDLVLAGFSDGSLVALSADGGEIAWERRVGEGRYPDLIATPVVADGVAFTGGYSEPLVAIDLVNRSIRWRIDVGSSSAATMHDGVLYHGGTDGKLRAIEPDTGDVLWLWDSETTGALTQPQVVDAGVLVASSDGTVYLVERETGLASWTHDPGYLLDGITVAPLVDGRQMVAITNAGRLMSMLSPRDALQLEGGRVSPGGPL